MKNFIDVPKEKDTRIIKQKEVIINGISALNQHWSWDGILADSLIFHSDDVAHLIDDESLRSFINEYADIKIMGSATFKRNSSGFCFVNFNFKTS